MISVSDSQLWIVATAADLLPGEARGKFLRRVVAELRESRNFNDNDVEQAVRAALLDRQSHHLIKDDVGSCTGQTEAGPPLAPDLAQ